jgi:hypothetical protein
MPTARNAIEVEGLQQLRRALKAVEADAPKELRDVIKDAARIGAEQAGRNAPRGTQPLGNRRPQKRLADAYVGTTSGAKGIIRNPLPHAAIYEYRKSGTPAQMRGVKPVDRALESKVDEIADLLAEGIDAVMVRRGFR